MGVLLIRLSAKRSAAVSAAAAPAASASVQYAADYAADDTSPARVCNGRRKRRRRQKDGGDGRCRTEFVDVSLHWTACPCADSVQKSTLFCSEIFNGN